MENALIVSNSDNDTAFFSAVLNAASVQQITCSKTADDARRHVLTQDFDFIIVDTPLKDESGENFSRYAASGGVSQIIMLVESKCFDSVSAEFEADGVMTISKPVDRSLFWSALLFAKSVQNRIKRIQTENAQLKQKIDDIRIIDRAKYLLITSMKMSESEAHRYIEKQAMDMRSTRRIIAEGILKRYENYQDA